MTKEQAKQLLPIITAFAEGKTIQVKLASSWHELRDPQWDARNVTDYRIKPEAREFWLAGQSVFNTEKAALMYVAKEQIIHVREILNDEK